MKVAIIGSQGYVGEAVVELFQQAKGVTVIEYDIKPPKSTPYSKKAVNNADVGFVCVPTPTVNKKCDISIVEEVVKWLNTKVIVINSTVPVGTTEMLANKYHKRIVHSPEFLRQESNITDILNVNRVVLGGARDDVEMVEKVYRAAYGNAQIQYAKTDSKTSELCKYITNCYLATKVTFSNEMKAISDIYGVEWDKVRKTFLLDSRISDSHTEVTSEGGFGGGCLPKDIVALIGATEENGYSPQFLHSVWESNRRFRSEFNSDEHQLRDNDDYAKNS
jgi:UDPglucose 6-dehydrogenase